MPDPGPGPLRLLVICNPSAGGGRGAKVLPDYLQLLDGDDVTVELTRDLEHAAELATRAAAEGRIAAADGGDGLVGRVAGATAAAGGLLAVLPGGRGNDFARAMGIPTDPAAAVAVLRAGVEDLLDLGSVDGRPFACIASLGFDSDVQEVALRSRLPLGGQIYAYAAVRCALRWKPATFSLDLDGEARVVRGWSVAAANTGVYGGGMRVAPDARTDDGLLDVVMTSATGRLRFLSSFRRVFAGTHTTLPEVSVQRVRRLRVSADRPFRVFADGDPIGVLPCEITVIPAALRLLVPPPPAEPARQP